MPKNIGDTWVSVLGVKRQMGSKGDLEVVSESYDEVRVHMRLWLDAHCYAWIMIARIVHLTV
jgi:hypothetical protein